MMIARPNFRPFCLARGDESGGLAVSLIENRFPLWWSEHAHQGAITHLAWSPDGQLLASGGEDGYVRVWLAASGVLCSAFAHGSAIRRLRWSQDSRRIVSLSHEQIRLWSLRPLVAVAA